MKITEITIDNFEVFKNDLVELNDAFLEELGDSKTRSYEEKLAILKNMIRADSPTHLLIILNEANKQVGFTYFNEGTGYSCGGNYIWMNGIYITPKEQQKGFGLTLLKYVEDWARVRDYNLLVCSRHVNNEKSKKLFAKANFEQTENISIDKVLHLH